MSSVGGDFLATMAAASRERVALARRGMGESELRRWAEGTPTPLPLQLSSRGFDVIAEVKLRSPAVGRLKAASEEDLAGRVDLYAAGGAAAVSVLTEPDRFEGSLDHLEQASRALLPKRVPTMRKDFLVDPYQVAEARLAGAGGVLVIVRMLPPGDLRALVGTAKHFGLFVLVECFDEADIAIARELAESAEARGARLLIGVNSRDLASLQVVPGRLEQLLPLLPTALPRVAESGIESAEDAARMAAAGYELALVGSSLMKAPDPRKLLSDMLEAGRRARS